MARMVSVIRNFRENSRKYALAAQIVRFSAVKFRCYLSFFLEFMKNAAKILSYSCNACTVILLIVLMEMVKLTEQFTYYNNFLIFIFFILIPFILYNSFGSSCTVCGKPRSETEYSRINLCCFLLNRIIC